MQFRVGLAATIVAAVFGCVCSAAFAVTPEWECMPTTVGQAVTWGGTAPTPNCGSETAVLAPTYVGTTIGDRPTVQFSGVNVQIVNGTGSETTLNGEGNLVIGYNQGAGPPQQTGSHNLVLGTANQTYTSYGGILAGSSNTISQPEASVLGGYSNVANDPFSMVAGGCDNLTGLGQVSSNSCNTIGEYETVTGGYQGGFNRSSQRWLVDMIADTRRAPRRVSSIRVSYEGGC